MEQQDDEILNAFKSERLLDAYIAGIVDNNFNYLARISKDSCRKVGYKIQLELRYKSENDQTIDTLIDYSDFIKIDPRINKQTNTKYDRYEFIISRRDDIRTFLDKLQSYLITQKAVTNILLNELIPRLERGDHSNKESFIEMIEYIEQFRELAGRNNRSKYNKEYFISEWDM